MTERGGGIGSEHRELPKRHPRVLGGLNDRRDRTPTHTALAVSLSTWAIKCIDNISRPKVGSAFWLGPEFVARLNWVVRASLTCSASDMRCA